MSKTSIVQIAAREILDSRGNPTVAAKVVLEGGAVGKAFVPSGASTGTHEALELRDEDPSRYLGKGVLKAVAHVNDVIAPQAQRDGRPRSGGRDRRLHAQARRHAGQDEARRKRDPVRLHGRRRRRGQGGRVAPLRLVCETSTVYTLPVPLINILNGGAHADNSVDIQEFMIAPAGLPDLRRGHPGRGRGLPQPEKDPEKEGLRHVGRRRGRIRAQPEIQRRGPGLHRRKHPEGRLRPGQADLSSPSTRPRPNFSTTANTSSRNPTGAVRTSAEMVEFYAGLDLKNIRSSPSRTAWPRTTGTAGRR